MLICNRTTIWECGCDIFIFTWKESVWRYVLKMIRKVNIKVARATFQHKKDKNSVFLLVWKRFVSIDNLYSCFFLCIVTLCEAVFILFYNLSSLINPYGCFCTQVIYPLVTLLTPTWHWLPYAAISVLISGFAEW
jgi:hypothetical protein